MEVPSPRRPGGLAAEVWGGRWTAPGRAAVVRTRRLSRARRGLPGCGLRSLLCLLRRPPGRESESLETEWPLGLSTTAGP